MDSPEIFPLGQSPYEIGQEALRLAQAHDANGLKALELCDEAALQNELADESVSRETFDRRRFRIAMAILAIGGILWLFSWPYAGVVIGFGMAVMLITGDLRRDRAPSIRERRQNARMTYDLARRIRRAIDEATLAVHAVEVQPPPLVPLGTFADPDKPESENLSS